MQFLEQLFEEKYKVLYTSTSEIQALQRALNEYKIDGEFSIVFKPTTFEIIQRSNIGSPNTITIPSDVQAPRTISLGNKFYEQICDDDLSEKLLDEYLGHFW